LGLLDRDIDLGIDCIECPLEWAVDGAEGRKRSGEAWAHDYFNIDLQAAKGVEGPRPSWRFFFAVTAKY